MQSTLLSAAMIGLISGSVAATAVVFSLSPNPAPTQEVQAENQIDVLARIDSIANQNAELQERLQILEDEAKMVAPSAGRKRIDALASVDWGDQLAELQAKLDQLAAPTAGMPLKQFEERVAEANKSIDARKRLERDEERQQREDQAMEDRLAKLTSSLGLDGRQVSRMRETLATQNTKRRELFTEMREGGWAGGRTAMRESMRVITDEANTALQGFLTPSQFEDYGKQNDGGGGGGGGGRQRGSNGGGF